MASGAGFAAALVAGLCLLVLAGFPVAFTLAGTAIAFAGIGFVLDAFEPGFLGFLPSRVFGVMTNPVLVAVPLFVFMGVILERSRIAERLLDAMTALLGRTRGGLGISVTLVGAVLAASTGIVGATVVTLGLLALPLMHQRGYAPGLAGGTVTAAGTLGQIIPPSIVLVVLGDQIATAHAEAQHALGNFAPDPVSVADLFAGALLPGLCLVAFYVTYQAGVAWLRPAAAPATPLPERPLGRAALLRALAAPVALMVAVLGSILAGIATPTEAAAVGAVGAVLLAAMEVGAEPRWLVAGGAVALVFALVLGAAVDLRAARDAIPPFDLACIIFAAALLTWAFGGIGMALATLHRTGMLADALRRTTRMSAMVFAIVIGAQVFTLVFRGFGGDDALHALLTDLPGGAAGAMLTVMAVMFVLGFFLEFLEITFIVVPVVAPVLLALGLDPVWLGVMIAVNLQTSFLTPPFGLALFYLKGAAPIGLDTAALYRGVVPFVIMQLLLLGLLALFPALATWLPSVMF